MKDLKQYLDGLVERFETPDFIEDDPISFPHRYSNPYDIEIAGFLASLIAWGNRKMIVRNTKRMAELMSDSPYDFVMNASAGDLTALDSFVHRTFNGGDFRFFVLSLRNIYKNLGGLRGLFEGDYQKKEDLRSTLALFYGIILADNAPDRTRRHVSSIEKGSACKRLNMFLRWMVRSSVGGVDFGLWNRIPASALWLPLDVHSGNTARRLGLLQRNANDWKAVEEVTLNLRNLSQDDPVRYDFALFSAGIEGIL